MLREKWVPGRDRLLLRLHQSLLLLLRLQNRSRLHLLLLRLQLRRLQLLLLLLLLRGLRQSSSLLLSQSAILSRLGLELLRQVYLHRLPLLLHLQRSRGVRDSGHARELAHSNLDGELLEIFLRLGAHEQAGMRSVRRVQRDPPHLRDVPADHLGSLRSRVLRQQIIENLLLISDAVPVSSPGGLV